MFKFKINNYRSFVEQEFNFSKYNVFIGENSSGKSSILKFFLLLKQSLKNENPHLTLDEPYVDIGNYKDMIYYNDENLELSFSFEVDYKKYYEFYMDFCTKDVSPEFRDDATEEIKTYTNFSQDNIKVKFTLNKNLEQIETLKIQIEYQQLGELTIAPNSKSKDSDYRLGDYECCLKYNSKLHNKEIIFENIGFRKVGFLTLIMPGSLRSACDKHSESINLYYEYQWLLVIQNYIRYEINNFTLMNPLDSQPKRFYYLREPKLKSDSTITNLDDYVHLLSGRKISDQQKKIFLKHFNSVIQDYGLAEKAELITDSNFRITEIKVKIKDLISNITEVGSGVPLQFSILFGLLLAGDKNYMIIQPEIHMHPKMQAEFIRILVKYGTARNYFIETHSEYLVRKLQILIKEKYNSLSSEDVSINYFRRVEKKSEITKHDFTEEGRLKPPFPSGFFDNSYLITSALVK